MQYIKIFLWSTAATFLVVGLFKDGIHNFSDVIVLMSLGTILLLESIKYKNNNRKDIQFYYTFIMGIIGYLLAAYILFIVLSI